MNIMELGAIGELVGGAAVIATLLYLAAQIRQNTRQMRGDAHVAMNTLAQRISSELRDDPELAYIILRASEDWDSVTPDEQFRAHLWNLEEAQIYETYSFLMREGLLSEELYHDREGHIARRMATPGARIWWEQYAYNFEPAFRERINARMSDPNSLTQLHSVPFFDAPRWSRAAKEA